jgi:hypothetical protein
MFESLLSRHQRLAKEKAPEILFIFKCLFVVTLLIIIYSVYLSNLRLAFTLLVEWMFLVTGYRYAYIFVSLLNGFIALLIMPGTLGNGFFWDDLAHMSKEEAISTVVMLWIVFVYCSLLSVTTLRLVFRGRKANCVPMLAR